MMTQLARPARWMRLVGMGIGTYLLQTGCAIDPDIALRAGITATSDLAVFLLENLAAGI